MSGSVLAVSMLTVGSALTIAVGIGGATIMERVVLQHAADEAALEAEDAQRGLITGFPCEVARAVATRFGYRLDTCRILNSEAWIALESEPLGIVINAKAHAGS